MAMVLATGGPAFSQTGSLPGQAEGMDMPVGGGMVSPGQLSGPGSPGGRGPTTAAPSISTTTLTFRSHQIGAGASAGNLEGASCAGGSTMISGACHPFYNDQVVIINQFPNTALNTWRCGFKNNTGSTVSVFIYTLCAQ